VTTPAVLPAVALLVGVVAGVRLRLPVPVAVLPFVAVLTWVLAVAAVGLRARPAVAALALVAGFTSGGFLLGATRQGVALDRPLVRWFGDQPDARAGRVGPVSLEGRLRRDAVRTDYGAVLDLAVERVGRAGGAVRCRRPRAACGCQSVAVW
jgi:hypothetical protein